jgi:hypothetical protein
MVCNPEPGDYSPQNMGQFCHYAAEPFFVSGGHTAVDTCEGYIQPIREPYSETQIKRYCAEFQTMCLLSNQKCMVFNCSMKHYQDSISCLKFSIARHVT